ALQDGGLVFSDILVVNIGPQPAQLGGIFLISRRAGLYRRGAQEEPATGPVPLRNEALDLGNSASGDVALVRLVRIAALVCERADVDRLLSGTEPAIDKCQRI